MRMELRKTMINIYNLTNNKFCDKAKLKRFIMFVWKKEKFYNLTTINIIIADASCLQELNKKFFRRNKPTNVISFDLGEIGEIYISSDEVSASEDLYYYLAHGLLHLLGYDHRTRKTEMLMDKKCRRYINSFLSV